MPHEPDVVLAWALKTKKQSQNNGGFTPNQLVYEHNVNTPSVLTDKLSPLQPIT